jgi:hypothetical protein
MKPNLKHFKGFVQEKKKKIQLAITIGKHIQQGTHTFLCQLFPLYELL